jgi:hypothetical protein
MQVFGKLRPDQAAAADNDDLHGITCKLTNVR